MKFFPMTREEKENKLKSKKGNCEIHGDVIFITKVVNQRHFIGRRWVCFECAKKPSKPRQPIKCEKCGKETFSNPCYSCWIKKNRTELEIKQNEYHYLLKDCQKMGTCDILKVHHEMLADDPERLRTDFLIGQICGNEGLKLYSKKE